MRTAKQILAEWESNPDVRWEEDLPTNAELGYCLRVCARYSDMIGDNLANQDLEARGERMQRLSRMQGFWFAVLEMQAAVDGRRRDLLWVAKGTRALDMGGGRGPVH